MSAVPRAAPASADVVVESELREILRRIEPTPTQKDGARRSQANLRRQLQGGGIGERILDAYLSGSYRRKTAIYPLEDVDIIIAIDPKGWPAAMFGLSDKPQPSIVLQSFASARRYRYSETSAFTQRRSVRLELNHLHVDCVPAIAIEGSDFIWVGDRKEDVWVKSSPKRHEAALIEANQQNDGLVVPIVKLLKCWNSGLPKSARLRSFVVETAAVTLFTRTRVASLLDGLLMFLDFIAHFASDDNEYRWSSTFGIRMSWWDSMTVPDTAGTGGNVAAGVEHGQMRAFQRHAESSREHLRKALSARSDGTLQRHLWSALNVEGR